MTLQEIQRNVDNQYAIGKIHTGGISTDQKLGSDPSTITGKKSDYCKIRKMVTFGRREEDCDGSGAYTGATREPGKVVIFDQGVCSNGVYLIKMINIFSMCLYGFFCVMYYSKRVKIN